jgi:hypothetical protein
MDKVAVELSQRGHSVRPYLLQKTAEFGLLAASSPELNLSLFYFATAVYASVSRPAATRYSRWIYVVHPRKAADDCRNPRRAAQSDRSRTSRKRLGLRQPSGALG